MIKTEEETMGTKKPLSFEDWLNEELIIDLYDEKSYPYDPDLSPQTPTLFQSALTDRSSRNQLINAGLLTRSTFDKINNAKNDAFERILKRNETDAFEAINKHKDNTDFLLQRKHNLLVRKKKISEKYPTESGHIFAGEKYDILVWGSAYKKIVGEGSADHWKTFRAIAKKEFGNLKRNNTRQTVYKELRYQDTENRLTEAKLLDINIELLIIEAQLERINEALLEHKLDIIIPIALRDIHQKQKANKALRAFAKEKHKHPEMKDQQIFTTFIEIQFSVSQSTFYSWIPKYKEAVNVVAKAQDS